MVAAANPCPDPKHSQRATSETASGSLCLPQPKTPTHSTGQVSEFRTNCAKGYFAIAATCDKEHEVVAERMFVHATRRSQLPMTSHSSGIFPRLLIIKTCPLFLFMILQPRSPR